MTEHESTGSNEDQLARIAALQAQRSGAKAQPSSPRPNKKRHVAMGARIAAAGIGATGALGIVAAFGVASAEPEETATAPERTQPVVVVVHDADRVYELIPAGDAEVAAATAVEPELADSPATRDHDDLFAALDQAPVPTPIMLVANPIVETIHLPGETIYVEVISQPAPALVVVGSPVATTTEPESITAAAPQGAPVAQSAPAPAVVAPTQPAPAPVVTRPAAPAPAPAPEPAPAPAAPEPPPEPPKTKGSG